jgi:DNA-binding transcriptional MerR regulator
MIELKSINKKIDENEKRPNVKIYDNLDAMKLLNVSRRTLQYWRDEKYISYSQISGKIYYSEQDILEFLSSNHCKKKP